MDPFTIMSIIGTVAGPIISAIGNAIAQGDMERARQLRASIAEQYGDELLPAFDAVVAQEVGPSAYEGLTEDAGLVGSQRDILGDMLEMARTGTTAADEAGLARAQRAASAQAAGQFQGIAQGAAQRLGGNSGVLQALYSQAGQQAADATADMALAVEQGAQSRRQGALSQAAAFSGGLRDADYRRMSDRARAADGIHRFNADARLRALLENNDAKQRAFGNAMALRDRRATALLGTAADLERKGEDTRETAGLVGAGVSRVPMAVRGAAAGQGLTAEEWRRLREDY